MPRGVASILDTPESGKTDAQDPGIVINDYHLNPTDKSGFLLEGI